VDEEQQVRRTGVVLVGVIAVICAAIYVSSVAGRRIHRFMSIEKMEERLSTDLPKGSSSEQADMYLVHNGIEHSLALDGKTMYGIINWIWGSWIVEVSAQIIIHFQDGKLDRIEVHSVGTFL
jgi:hypothetical protein